MGQEAFFYHYLKAISEIIEVCHDEEGTNIIGNLI